MHDPWRAGPARPHPYRGRPEVWALLVAYQVLRTAMADATDSVPDTDPDRAGFTIALSAARDQLVLAAGVIATPPSTWPGPSAVTYWPS